MVSAIKTVNEKMDQKELDSITVLETPKALKSQCLIVDCPVQGIVDGAAS